MVADMRYAPTEEKGIQKQYIFMQTEDGQIRLIDLHRKPKNVFVTPANVTFHLYTKDSTAGEIISSNNLDDLINSKYFNPNNKNIFTAHGWTSGITSGVNVRVRNALFRNNIDVNAFGIDWTGPAGQFYTHSVMAVPLVADIVANYINEMKAYYQLAPSDFILIGHSLGAHVIGCAGASINGLVDTIVGIDPAFPGFRLEDRDNRLDETDGQFVQVIHTNGGFRGFLSSIGHVDYFPNGGIKQAGCGSDILGSCSHSRAVDLYVESLITSRFRSVLCSSYEDFQGGLCSGNPESYIGGFPVDKTAFGDYYLDTADSSPYALG